MYIKTALDADDPGISIAILSERTAEVHVYQKLLFDAGVQGIKRDSVIEQRRFMYTKSCSLMRMVHAYSKQYSVIEQRRFMYIKTAL